MSEMRALTEAHAEYMQAMGPPPPTWGGKPVLIVSSRPELRSWSERLFSVPWRPWVRWRAPAIRSGEVRSTPAGYEMDAATWDALRQSREKGGWL